MKLTRHRRPKELGPVPEGFRYCWGCRKDLPVEAFAKSGTACRPCRKAQLAAYHESRKHHDPTAEKRFWAKVEKRDNGCWEWTGCIRPDGYGQMMFQGTVRKAHRIALMLDGVEVPSRDETGMVVDHICRNTLCVRPDHLRIVPQTDNIGKYADRSKMRERILATWAANGTKPGRKVGTKFPRKRDTSDSLS